jgi:purine-cytosine permease-like protein
MSISTFLIILATVIVLYIIPAISNWYFISKSYYHKDGKYFGSEPNDNQWVNYLIFMPILNLIVMSSIISIWKEREERKPITDRNILKRNFKK